MLSVLFEQNLFMCNYLKAVQSGLLFKTNHISNRKEDTEYFLIERIINACL